MRWPSRAKHQQRDRETWADLITPHPALVQLAEEVQTEAAAAADALAANMVVILESGLSVPRYLAGRGEDWE